MSIVTTATVFQCDATACQNRETLKLPHGSGTLIPEGWLVDLTRKYHACSEPHSRTITTAHYQKHGKRLLWLHHKEAPLT